MYHRTLSRDPERELLSTRSLLDLYSSHLAAAFTSTSLPSDLQIVHVSRFSKFKFSRQIHQARHLAAALTTHKFVPSQNLILPPKYQHAPSSGCTRNYVHSQSLPFCKFPTNIHVLLRAIQRQWQKPETRHVRYRPPFSTDSNHLPSVGKVGTTYPGLKPSIDNCARTGLTYLFLYFTVQLSSHCICYFSRLTHSLCSVPSMILYHLPPIHLRVISFFSFYFPQLSSFLPTVSFTYFVKYVFYIFNIDFSRFLFYREILKFW